MELTRVMLKDGRKASIINLSLEWLRAMIKAINEKDADLLPLDIITAEGESQIALSQIDIEATLLLLQERLLQERTATVTQG